MFQDPVHDLAERAPPALLLFGYDLSAPGRGDVAGVVWLTRYGQNERAHTLRLALRNDGSILIL